MVAGDFCDLFTGFVREAEEDGTGGVGGFIGGRSERADGGQFTNSQCCEGENGHGHAATEIKYCKSKYREQAQNIRDS